MGFVRSSFFVIASVLLFFSFLALNTFWILDSSLEYDNVHPALVSAANDFIKEELNLIDKIGDNFMFMKLYCQNNSDFVFSDPETGFVFEISCDSINKGVEEVINEGISDFVDKVYYKDYECSFLNCFKEADVPFFLVSEKAKNYWHKNSYFALIISVFLILLMFFLIEKKTSLPFVVGGLMMLSALPFVKLNSFLSYSSNKAAIVFFKIFFSESGRISLKTLFIGLGAIAFGIFLKFFVIGFKISDIFSRLSKNSGENPVSKEEVKDLVKEEVSKSKEQSSGKKQKPSSN